MRYFISADSQVLARMVGQRSQRRFFESSQTTQLVSGKLGVSANSKRGDQVFDDLRQRAPSILTSSDWRSPEPWNQETNKSPFGNSTTEDEWLVPGFGREDQFSFVQRLGGKKGE